MANDTITLPRTSTPASHVRLEWPQTNRSASWLFTHKDELMRLGYVNLFVPAAFESRDSTSRDRDRRIDSSVPPATLARARLDLAAAERCNGSSHHARDFNRLPHLFEAALAYLEGSDVPSANRVFYTIAEIRQRLPPSLFNSRPSRVGQLSNQELFDQLVGFGCSIPDFKSCM